MRSVAMYLRLSMEDKRGMDESNSISGQRALLISFISQDKELAEYEVKEFCDDGWSGTGMDRPGMNRLLAEVKKNRIQCIIVKDMSRFSRDYIEMGTYLNRIFPFMGVRFIALGDHYDSREDNGSAIGIDTAFKTILYDLYSKDISVKVKTSFENKCANGEYVFGQVPFGYMKSPVEKNKVIINKEEAEIVRHIFFLAVRQKSSIQIARRLCEEGVPTVMQMRRPDGGAKDGKAHAWSAGTVRNILNNRFYLGEMAYGKTIRKSVGSKNSIAVPKEEWKVIPDHHEALVTPEVYEQVSSFKAEDTMKKKKSDTPVHSALQKHLAMPGKEKHPLTGKLYCGGCRYSMSYKPLRGKNKYRRFECRKHAMLRIPECCTYFRADVLEELVLSMINKELLIRGEAEGQEKSLHMFKKSQIDTIRNQLGGLYQEKRQSQAAKDTLYEEYADGRIAQEEYRHGADELDRQAEILSGQIHDRQEELSALEEELERLDADMKQIIRYSHMEELTQELTGTFIERIYVYKDKKMEIKWRFRENNLTLT